MYSFPLLMVINQVYHKGFKSRAFKLSFNLLLVFLGHVTFHSSGLSIKKSEP